MKEPKKTMGIPNGKFQSFIQWTVSVDSENLKPPWFFGKLYHLKGHLIPLTPKKNLWFFLWMFVGKNVQTSHNFSTFDPPKLSSFLMGSTWRTHHHVGGEHRICERSQVVREKNNNWLVVSTHLKNMLVKIGSFP